jgi:hypothetical protein
VNVIIEIKWFICSWFVYLCHDFYQSGSACIGGSYMVIQRSATDLGITIYSELTILPYIQNVARSYLSLRQPWPIHKRITCDVSKTLVPAFIYSRIDYKYDIVIA